MEQPPTPSEPSHPSPNFASGEVEPDLPKPPIWQQSTAQPPPSPPRPPITIPSAAAPAPLPGPQIEPAVPLVAPVAQPTPLAMPTPAAQVPIVPDITAAASGAPTDRGYATMPASGAGTSSKPRWPTEPPTFGHHASPTPPPARAPKRRVGLVALALLAVAAVVASAFFVGRSFATSETATIPISAPTAVETPTSVPEPTEPPAVATPVPATPSPAVDNAVPVPLPLEGADEPVAAVAAAVAPAVVLIQNELGQGSGIIYDNGGLILTNAHVVGSFTEVQVTLASGVRVPGNVLGADPLTDVAVVSIDTDSEYGVAPLAPESSVQVGQLAVAIGSPFGLEQTVTSGIVSAIGRVLTNPTDGGAVSIVSMIQTDAPINPGNSGGALADRQGRVIGMNTSIRTDGTGGNIGVGFAIPADTAKLIADRIVNGEPLEQGFLGIGGNTPVIGKPGVVVSEITPGSGAQAAGIEVGDLITSLNGEPIKSITDLAAAVRLQAPDATVTIDFEREGEPFQVAVTLGLFVDS